VCALPLQPCILANRQAGGYMNFEEAELKLAELGVPPGTILGTTSE
jgi:hypothetical protein